MNQFLWILLQSINNLSSTIVSIFLSIFIWQKTGNLDFIFRYFLSLFIFMPLFGFVGAILSEKFSFKYSFFISLISQFIFILFILKYSDYLIQNPVLFGVINSISIGLFAIPRNAAHQLMSRNNISGGNSLLSVIGGIISLSIPILGSYWISISGNYNGIFALAGIAILIGSIVNTLIIFPKSNGTFDFLIYKQFIATSDFIKILILRFFDGLKNGIEWAFMGIIILGLIGGDLNKWGIVNFMASLAGILSGMFYMRIISKGYDKPTIFIASILYTLFGILLFAKFDLINFFIYMVGTTITSSFIGSASSKLWSDVFKESGGNEYNSNEFYSLLEIPLMFGRIIPIFLLFYFNLNLNSKLILGILFLFISTIPLLSTYVLQKTKAFKA